MPRCAAHSIRQIGHVLQSKRVRPTTVVLALFFLIPVAALAQGSPFDTGFSAMQNLFTGTVAKVASLIAIVVGGYQFRTWRAGREEDSRRCCRGNWNRRSRDQRTDLALGNLNGPRAANLQHRCSREALMQTTQIRIDA